MSAPPPHKKQKVFDLSKDSDSDVEFIQETVSKKDSMVDKMKHLLVNCNNKKHRNINQINPNNLPLPHQSTKMKHLLVNCNNKKQQNINQINPNNLPLPLRRRQTRNTR